MVKDEWLSAAMADDRVVVELLVRLKQSQASSPLKAPLPVTVPLLWGIRQPRSRTATATASRCDGVLQRNKDVDSARCSPTTPLSWSGGASPSADGYEESSRPANLAHAASRFKGSAANESTATTTAAKRFRRKKVRTFAELKDEESMLMKEKLHLKKELATLRATFEEQKAKNDYLKKMKMDFELQCSKTLSRDPDGPEETRQRESSNLDTIPPNLPVTESDHCEAQETDSTDYCGFFLPDLNMTPSASED